MTIRSIAVTTGIDYRSPEWDVAVRLWD